MPKLMPLPWLLMILVLKRGPLTRSKEVSAGRALAAVVEQHRARQQRHAAPARAKP